MRPRNATRGITPSGAVRRRTDLALEPASALLHNTIMKNMVLVVGMLAAGCTADEPPGEWPCRSASDDGAIQKTYEYDSQHNITREVNVGSFPYSVTARWSGNVPVEYQMIGTDDDRFDYRLVTEVDDDNRLLKRTYTALGAESGESYVQSWAYAAGRAVTGTRVFTGGKIQKLTFTYADDVMTVRECEDDIICAQFTYAGDPRAPRRYEADYGADGTLDYWVDYEYDANDLPIVRDAVSVHFDGTEDHDRREITRRPYGAPELEVTSGSYSQVLTYEFCSEDASPP
jgi:hypothetical protein